jgi:hypothetical protein
VLVKECDNALINDARDIPENGLLKTVISAFYDDHMGQFRNQFRLRPYNLIFERYVEEVARCRVDGIDEYEAKAFGILTLSPLGIDFTDESISCRVEAYLSGPHADA